MLPTVHVVVKMSCNIVAWQKINQVRAIRKFLFLNTSSHLYKRVCPFVCPYVRPSVSVKEKPPKNAENYDLSYKAVVVAYFAVWDASYRPLGLVNLNLNS